MGEADRFRVEADPLESATARQRDWPMRSPAFAAAARPHIGPTAHPFHAG